MPDFFADSHERMLLFRLRIRLEAIISCPISKPLGEVVLWIVLQIRALIISKQVCHQIT